VVRLGLPITFLVFSNSTFGWIKAGQKASFGERYYSVDFTRTKHADVARAYGLQSWTVEDPAALRNVLASAIDHPGPSLIDIIAQPLQDARSTSSRNRCRMRAHRSASGLRESEVRQ
jgi:acetolactate synthase-1/2/3 large subunit